MSEPKQLKDVLKAIGSNIFQDVVEKLSEADQWRQWAVKTLNRIDMQNATNEELQKALEDKMRA